VTQVASTLPMKALRPQVLDERPMQAPVESMQRR
jgi:hypothetical protein